MKVELLAPGGSFESVIAAYNAGADAVYTGGLMFGARAGADNLTQEQLVEAINYAHIHGRKLYLTINTLLKDTEIESNLYDFIAPLYENGLDAVIVQDMGVVKFVHDNFAGLPIHASTQMTIYGAETVKELQKMGITRIVTPRELSSKEIKDIYDNTGMEIESFIHGALCYCYSGQCFLSSYIGGRSGNRGRCAQPCRMEYDVLYNGKNLNPGNNKYVLSPKDMCTLNILPQIIESGVYSLKIEGRMKKTEYITGVVSIYRKYIDLYIENPKSYSVKPSDIQLLHDLFNRNGFNESYYNQHNGRNMISLKKPDFRKENREFNQYLKNTYVGKKLKKSLDISVRLKDAKPFEISADVDGEVISVKGDIPGEAINKPLDIDTIVRQMNKTGNTDFSLNHVTVDMDNNLFVPIGAINELRRKFFETLSETLISKHYRTINKTLVSNENSFSNYQKKSNEKTELCKNENKYADSLEINVSVWNKEQLECVLKESFITRIYLEASGFSIPDISDGISKAKENNKSVYIAMPYVFRKKDKEIFAVKWQDIIKCSDGILIRSPEQYYSLKNLDVVKNYIFDYNVYTENRIAKDYYLNSGKAQMNLNDNSIQTNSNDEAYTNSGRIQTTVPMELNYKELIKRGCGGDEFIVYGYMPAMISAGCSLKTCNMCMKENALYEIKDRKGNFFKTRCVCESCHNIMYNCKPLSLFKFKDEINSLNPDSVRLAFTVENKIETENILKMAKQSMVDGLEVVEDDKSTRGHFKRGVL